MTPNTGKRPGRMLAALIASENAKGKMELTVTLTPTNGQALHRAFRIRKWVSQDGTKRRLYVSLPGTADWAAGVKPVTPLAVDLGTGQVWPEKKDPRMTPQILYAAQIALDYARSGEVAKQPTNGSIEVKEATVCGACGLKLTDPVSIERGIGPDCYDKQTGAKAIKLGASLTDYAAKIAAGGSAAPAQQTLIEKSEVEHAQEALARAEARIATGDHSEAAYDHRDEAAKWLYKATVESAA